MTNRRDRNSRIVYSTAGVPRCPGCGEPVEHCRCAAQPRPANDGIVRVRRETKGRKGAGVTVVTGIPLDDAGLAKLARELKQTCGSGGTVKDGAIELQGDHRDLVMRILATKGYTAKRQGG